MFHLGIHLLSKLVRAFVVRIQLRRTKGRGDGVEHNQETKTIEEQEFLIHILFFHTSELSRPNNVYMVSV